MQYLDASGFPSGSGEVFILGCERHIARLLEVNLGRLGYHPETYPTPEDIPIESPQPKILVFDGDHILDEPILKLVETQRWQGTDVIVLGSRPSQFRSITSYTLRSSVPRWIVAVFTLLFVLVCYVILRELG